MQVAICIITYRRPEGIKRLIRACYQLRFPTQSVELKIIVVDNDQNESARAVCDDLRADTKFDLRYVVERRRGIPFARNRGIQEAQPWADYVAFIDDDEFPDPDWLDRLMAGIELFAADVATGPVNAVYESGIPNWIATGGFFDRPRYEQGAKLDRAFTNNVLISKRVLEGMDSKFDERMALTGGSDSHFFQRVADAGFKIVWVDDAIVNEHTPASRATPNWLIKRSYRTGNRMSFIARDLHPGAGTAFVVIAKALAWIAWGIIRWPLVRPFGRGPSLRASRHVAYGLGLFAGYWGKHYEEYRTVHGR